MAIVQISKIQQRAGNLVDLPQLDNAEFGWATDTNRLFIGRTGNAYTDENIEVLTSYSNISFSQINGSDGGNFNVTTPLNGQILTYVSSTDTWENYKGNTSQLGGTKLQLGDVSNISMLGGAIAYVLETDGQGNLSWSPKGTLYTNIKALSSADPVIMTVANTTPYVNGASVTISGVAGTNANTIVNGQSFYITLANDYPTTGNVGLYTDVGRTIGANGTTMTATANTGVATTIIAGGGSSSVIAGGANTSVQFNDQNITNGVAAFTFNKSTTTLTLTSGNVISANINATTAVTSPVLVSNIAIGTAPLTVTSTTRVSNLNVAYANVSDYSVTTLQTTGTWYPLIVNATSGNLAQGANANLSFNAATGALSATLLTGTLTTAAQPNITSTGILTSLEVTGNITGGNLVGPHASGNSNIAITPNANITFTANSNSTMVISATGANITGTANVSGNANVGNLGTATAIITTGNITTINSGLLQSGNSNINLTANANIAIAVTGANRLVVTSTGANITGTANVSGNANVGNLGTAGQIISSIADGTAPLVVTSTTRVANLNVNEANVANYANVVTQIAGTFYPTMVSGSTSANYQLGSNVNLSFAVATGTLSATLLTGALTTAAQPNITSTGILTSLSVTGNITNGNVTGGNLVSANYLTGTLTTAAQPNVTSVGILTGLTLSNTAIISVGSNTNVGTFTGNFSLSAGSRLNATYADLAEYYEADKPYEPGTVLEFGGEKEVTLAQAMTPRVAGVVSTNPAYVMNSTCEGEHIVAIALQGRVPCKVRGTIRKGDLLISDVGGFARPSSIPLMGTVIGKSLENFEGEGVIEVAVGRL